MVEGDCALEMYAVKVKAGDGEAARRALARLGVLDREWKIGHQNGLLLIPVTKKPIEGFAVINVKLEKQEKHPLWDLPSALGGLLTKEELSRVKRSFDIIGSVAVLEIGLPEEKEKLVAETMLKAFPSVKTVCKKAGAIEDEFRVRPIKVLAGDGTETIYVEHGCRMKLDVGRVYFSPRLSTERLRVAKQVAPGERVLVMFAGVGPYALLIAKLQPDARVWAVEKNPAGVKYLKENIALNKLEGRVEAFLGDVRKVVPKLGMKFDRIVMPLPKGAGDFLDVAFAALKNGGIVHFYGFGKNKTEAVKTLEDATKREGVKLTVLSSKTCGEIGPKTYRLVVDAQIHPRAGVSERLKERDSGSRGLIRTAPKRVGVPPAAKRLQGFESLPLHQKRLLPHNRGTGMEFTKALKGEHRLIERILATLTESAKKLQENDYGDKFEPKLFRRGMDLIMDFGIKCHMKKEDILISEIKDRAKDITVVEHLLEEHNYIGMFVNSISRAIDVLSISGSEAERRKARLETLQNFKEYSELVRHHIAMVDGEFFPLCEEILSDGEKEKLLEKFKEVEAGCTGMKKKAVSETGKLEKGG